MEKKISIFGIGIDNLTPKESLKRTITLMKADRLGRVEVLTMDMLLKTREDQELKELLDEMDLLLPESGEILQTAEHPEEACGQAGRGHSFSQLLLKYMQKSRQRIFLMAGEEAQRQQSLQLLSREYRGMNLIGSAVLETSAEAFAEEAVINEINGLEIDCILSLLPSPQQEDFISRAFNMLNARLWLGVNGALRGREEEKKTTYRAKTFFLRRRFRYSIERENHQVQERKNSREEQ